MVRPGDAAGSPVRHRFLVRNPNFGNPALAAHRLQYRTGIFIREARRQEAAQRAYRDTSDVVNATEGGLRIGVTHVAPTESELIADFGTAKSLDCLNLFLGPHLVTRDPRISNFGEVEQFFAYCWQTGEHSHCHARRWPDVPSVAYYDQGAVFQIKATPGPTIGDWEPGYVGWIHRTYPRACSIRRLGLGFRPTSIHPINVVLNSHPDSTERDHHRPYITPETDWDWYDSPINELQAARIIHAVCKRARSKEHPGSRWLPTVGPVLDSSLVRHERV